MLKGISPLISPRLLEVMTCMGHGDELVLADTHFPGETAKYGNIMLKKGVTPLTR